MAAVATTSLAPFGNPAERTRVMLAQWAGVTDEKAHLQGIVAFLTADQTLGAYYSLTEISARIAAI